MRRLISLFTRSSGLVDQIFFQCTAGKPGERGDVVRGVAEHRLDLGQLPAEHRGDDVELLADVARRRAGRRWCGSPRRPSRRCPWAPGRGRCAGSGPGTAASSAPSRTAAIAAFRPAWASEMTSCTPARPRALSERRNAVQNAPSSLSPDVEAEHLAVPVRRHPGRDHDGLGHDPVVHPGLAVGGVQEHVRERLAGQAAVAERGDLAVQVRADPRHLRLADPGIGTEGLDQVVDLAGRRAVQIGLHDHGEQRLVHPPRRSSSEGKNDPARSLGIRNSRSPALEDSVRARYPFRYPVRASVR